ncbi:MAG: hypothetical protein Q9167_001009 [Letrouitia subvulpina]
MKFEKVLIGPWITSYTYLVFIFATLAYASPAPLSTAISQSGAATLTTTRYNNTIIDYPIPHSNIILEIEPYSFDPSREPRYMTHEIVVNVLERAFRLLLRRAHAHGGMDEFIESEFEFEALGLMVDVFPHSQTRSEWPTYGDVGTVLQGLKTGLRLVYWKESVAGVFRRRPRGGKGEEFAVVKYVRNSGEV